MNVLSLFDGMSCGRIALERAGIHVDNYYAAEIDKYAIKVSEKNYPDIIRLGDVTQWRNWELPKIDLILAGSPCQGFSFAGKQLAFDDPRSKLFFTFIDIAMHHCHKNLLFLLENVKMKKEFRDVISQYIGCEPIEINSALVSAQNRRRLYWTNIPVEQPEDREIYLKDVVLSDVLPVELDGLRGKQGCFGEGYARVYTNKSTTLRTPSGGGNIPSLVKNDFGVAIIQRGRGKNLGGLKLDKSPTITANRWEENHKLICGRVIGRTRKDGKRIDHKQSIAGISTQELELRSDNKSNCLSTVQKDNILLDGLKLTDEAIAYMGRKVKGGRSHWDFKHHFDIHDPKSAAVVANFFKGVPYNVFKDWDCVRKFHPIECERLQTVPDRFTESVSTTQRFKMLGNGWTVDVIAHILSGIKS